MKQDKKPYFLFLYRYKEILKNDPRIELSHKSFYDSLFHFWNLSKFEESFYIIREELILDSKVNHPKTYKKIFDELQKWGYLKYIPGESKTKLLEVYMKTFTLTELELIINTGRKEVTEFDNLNSKKKRIANKYQFLETTTSNLKRFAYYKYILSTSKMKRLYPESISNLNGLNDETISNLNRLNDETISNMNGLDDETISNMNGLDDETISLLTDNHFKNEDIYNTTTNYYTLLNNINQKINNNNSDEQKRKKVAQKKESNVPPTLSEVQKFFISNNSSEQLANKFYEHYSKRQWCYNDSIKITDWKIPANYWINNTKGGTKQKINYDEKF